METLQKTGEHLIEAIAYGDAAGVPVETKSALYIASNYGTIDHLIAAKENPFYVGEWSVGTWSDDTQLSIAMAQSLTFANGFDLDVIAREHIDAYNETPKHTKRNGQITARGWGGSTTRSVQRMIEGTRPEVAGEKDGSGNGILMKMAPLAYWHAVRGTSDEERYEQYDKLTTMTHDSDIARACTRVHGDVLQYLLTQDFDAAEFCDVAYSSAYYHERALGAPADITGNLAYLGDNLRPTQSEILAQYADRAQGMTDRQFGFKYGFYAPETLAIAYGAFLQGNGEFHASVYAAVNLGGDADSTASIAAAMVNFKERGNQAFPRDGVLIHDVLRLHEVSRNLARAALSTEIH
jgi:ADP-ribosylglycohydrolase